MRTAFTIFRIGSSENVYLYRKLLALTRRKKPREDEAEYDGGEVLAWAESGGERLRTASDIVLYERQPYVILLHSTKNIL